MALGQRRMSAGSARLPHSKQRIRRRLRRARYGATSHLDEPTEAAIAQALANYWPQPNRDREVPPTRMMPSWHGGACRPPVRSSYRAVSIVKPQYR